MQTVNKDSIEKKLIEATNINKEIKNIKHLLLNLGYKDYSDEDRLLFIKASGVKSDTIDIDIRKYNIRFNNGSTPKNEDEGDTSAIKTFMNANNGSTHTVDVNLINTQNEIKKEISRNSEIKSIEEESINKKALKFPVGTTIFMLFMLMLTMQSFDLSSPGRLDNFIMDTIGVLLFVFVFSYIVSYMYLWAKYKKKESNLKEQTDPNYIVTPGQKAGQFFVGGLVKIIGLIVLVSIFSKGQGLPAVMIGLPGALIILTIIVWIYHSIKQSNAAKSISKITKNTVDNMAQPKPKNTKDSLDALSNAHTLLEKGAITQKEFDKIKQDILL